MFSALSAASAACCVLQPTRYSSASHVVTLVHAAGKRLEDNLTRNTCNMSLTRHFGAVRRVALA